MNAATRVTPVGAMRIRSHSVADERAVHVEKLRVQDPGVVRSE